MSPRPVKTARKAFWLATHWKIALVLVLLIGPLVGYSWYSCSQTREGCSTFSLATGVIRILAKPFT